MSLSKESNWDEYYTNEKVAVPQFIIDILWKNYETVIAAHLNDSHTSGLVVAELGGANSCFYEMFRKRFDVDEYHIFDNNKIGLELFPHKDDKGTFLHDVDLLTADLTKSLSADIVYSGGLIEHFIPSETEHMVDVHFQLARSGGLALISFPTPTVAYWMFRGFATMIGRFAQLYERPIRKKEIMPILAKWGKPLEVYKIWSTLSTQLITISRKS